MSAVPEVPGHDGDTSLRLTLFAALDQLSSRDRAIVVLRYWEDQSVDDTAATLGLSPATRLIHRSVRRRPVRRRSASRRY
jgi:DNA-directed RNA polymerase specialized sigma24 family protein